MVGWSMNRRAMLTLIVAYATVFAVGFVAAWLAGPRDLMPFDDVLVLMVAHW